MLRVQSLLNYFHNIVGHNFVLHQTPEEMKFTFQFVLLTVLFSSCATVFNSPTMKLTLTTNESVKLVVDKDTLSCDSNSVSVEVKRSRNPLNLELISDSSSRMETVTARMSAAYYFNFIGSIYIIPPIVALGIDQTNPKRFAYPKQIYFDLNDPKSSYLTYNPLKIADPSYIFKLAPLSVLNSLNPGLELGLELKGRNNFSSQYSASYLLPYYIINDETDYGPYIREKQSGYAVSFEEKYYFTRPAPNGPYVSLEGRFLSKEYEDVSRFGPSKSSSYMDTFQVARQAISVNAKIGYQKIINQFVIDAYLGMGVTFNSVENYDRKNPDDKLTYFNYVEYFKFSDFDMVEGVYRTISLPINVKIGWTFK